MTEVVNCAACAHSTRSDQPCHVCKRNPRTGDAWEEAMFRTARDAGAEPERVLTPVHTEAANMTLVGGVGINDLSAEWRPTDQTIVTTWALDDEQRAIIAAGGCIQLEVLSKMHPPVRLSVVER